MDSDEDWNFLLKDHPIFSLQKEFTGPAARPKCALELSTNTLPRFTQFDSEDDSPTPSGRRQTVVLKDADLILAAGKELRMTSLGDIKLGRNTKKTFKTLHTPNLCFEIHQISLNSSGKLLAVAGAFQVAVVVLPRSGYNRLVPETIECKSVHVGQFYHAANDSAPIAKIDWHPWGEAGSTLLVMTTDGKLREYDISIDTEEPEQVLSFVSERKSKAFIAEDESEREVTSFVLGRGHADWGPLTMYALMKSGDVYAICPYMPKNASIPSSYIHSLECFISAKQEFLSQAPSVAPNHLSSLYDYQRKYVNALIKQLPPGTVFPAVSRSVLMHPPKTISSPAARQGPFLLQPSPRLLDGSEGGDATDIAYMAFGANEVDVEEDGSEAEHLGVIMVACQDGKVDLFLDVEKVEARWDVKQLKNRDLPMLAVYETIDLGLVSSLKQISSGPNDSPLLDLLQGNHPIFVQDPIHDDTIYIYHAFGVHALSIAPVLQSLADALRSSDDTGESSLNSALTKSAQTVVRPLLATFSIERKCSNPVVGVAIPNDVYLTYSIFILTSMMRVTTFPLSLQTESPRSGQHTLPSTGNEVLGSSTQGPNAWLVPVEGPSSYVSLLGTEVYKPPPILQSSGLPPLAKLSLPPNSSGSKEFMLTPDTLRYIGAMVAQIGGQVQEIQIAQRAAEARVLLQKQEMSRQAQKCREMEHASGRLKASTQSNAGSRVKQIEGTQKSLMKRLDRLLQTLMEKASPELSEHETKWFEELKRMKKEVLGNGRYDEESLAARTKLLEREYSRLMPGLKDLLEKEKQRNERTQEINRNLGFSQAFEYGKRSNEEGKRISKVEQEVTRLAGKLEVSLARPPTVNQ